MQHGTAGVVCVYDDRGRLIGMIPHPRSGDPIGPGREKVFLERPALRQRPAAASAR